jgi:hypothetical protein
MSDENITDSASGSDPEILPNSGEASLPTSVESEEDNSFDLSQDIADILASFSSEKSKEAPNKTRESSESLNEKNRIDYSNKRAHFRHPVRWRVAIVNKSGGKHEIFHGRTNDVSLSGISILLERNVVFTSEVVVLLAIPPMHQGLKETIVEIQCALTHTVLDSVHNQFRLGMRFIHFKRDGQKILSDVLSKRHIPKQEPNPYTSKV